MFLNGNAIESGYVDAVSTAQQHEMLSFQSTISFKKGDEIQLLIWDMAPGTYPSGIIIFNKFSGYLLEENIVMA